MTKTVSRRVVATGFEEAMRLALADWNENWRTWGALHGVTISQDFDPRWRTERGHLRADFSVIFEFVEADKVGS